MQDFKKLAVWQRAHKLTLSVYKLSEAFPSHETFGLTSQVRRAAASIPANIAEGCGRDGGADFARFLQIALGSTSELEYHLLLGRDLGYLDSSNHRTSTDEVSEIRRMLATLIQRVRVAPRRLSEGDGPEYQLGPND